MESSRLHIRTATAELTLEGPMEEVVKQGPGLLKGLMEIIGEAPALPDDSAGSKRGKGSADIQMTTSNIAAKLNAKSGVDLVRAASAHLSICRGHGTFSRQQLLDEMKSASGYFKESYGKNLSNYLKSAVKDDLLREPSSGTYALSAASRGSLESTLA